MAKNKPRVWPAIVVGAACLPFGWLCGLVLVLVLLGVEALFGPNRLNRWILEADPSLFLTASLSGEILFLGALAWLARHSHEKPSKRFALERSRLSIWMLPAALTGSLAAGSIGATLTEVLFNSESELRLTYNEALGQGPFLAFLLTMAILPAITEELLFRGYVQGRLLKRFPAAGAILLSSVLFAAAHGELQYAVAVFPTGLWLGYVAFLADSIWLSIATHFLGNALVVALAVAATPSSEGKQALDPATIAQTLPALVALLLLGRLLLWRRKRDVTPIPLAHSPLRPF